MDLRPATAGWWRHRSRTRWRAGNPGIQAGCKLVQWHRIITEVLEQRFARTYRQYPSLVTNLFDPVGARLHGGRHPRNRPRPRGSLLQRFNRHVIRPDDPDACWGWSAALFESGYPAIAAEPPSRAMLLGHRVSYELHVGPIPPELCCLHRCDVRSCTNPAHLFLGTKADNNHDKIAKGRQPCGEAHHLAKLTQAQADLIRAIHAGKASMQQIAALFGVSRALVSSGAAEQDLGAGVS